MSEVKAELKGMKEAKNIETKVIEDLVDVRQDITDIKTILVKNINPNNDPGPNPIFQPNYDMHSAATDNSAPRTYLEAFQSKPGPFNSRPRQHNPNIPRNKYEAIFMN